MRVIYNQFTNNLPNYINDALRAFSHQFQTCIPAIVKEVKSRDTVVVSPAVQQTASDNSALDWASITTTVLTPFAGGIFLSLPLAVGDTGWLVASDLDTEKFKETKKPAQQTVFSRHKYRYGFFVPDAINGYTVSEDDSGAVVLSTLDGKTKITLKDKEINLVSDDALKINAKSVSITSSGNNVTIDGTNWKTHTHNCTVSGVTSGESSASGITGGVN